uniref:PORR domain-containing protein n=1 Tax=Oryza rufipogon TaxID=4529 RepID=A0A0E0MZA6_ORYRU
MSSEFAANGGIHGSLTGISIGVGVSSTQKAFGDIAFAHSFSNILIEIQQTLFAHRCLLCFVVHDTIKAPPPSEVKVMKSATRLSVVTTTVFYMLCGCMGYALPDNLLTGLGFYESFWLLDVANVVHLPTQIKRFLTPIRPTPTNHPIQHTHHAPSQHHTLQNLPQTPPPPPPSPWRAAAAAAGYASKSTTLPQKQQRVRDHAFDGIMEVQKRVRRFLALHSLLLYAAAPTALAGGGGGAVSVPFSRLGALARRQLRLAPLDAGRFLLRHPHAFHLFLHPVHRVLHARLTPRAAAALRLEADAVASSLPASIVRIRKLLLLAPPHHRLRLEHIRLLRRDLGLPDDFAESIIQAHPALFRLTPDQFVEFVPSPSDPPGLSVAAVERAREQHYREHRNPGAGEEDVRFAFPTRFPPGFKIGKYFRIAVWKWQRLPYASPYADVSGHDLRSLEARRRMEKRAVAAVHELLSLTVEKRTTLERLALFRDALGVPKKIKEFLLKYQGIFYISTRGNQGKLHTVFLREAYYKGELVEPNEIYAARRKLEELLMLNPQKANLDRMFTSMGRGWDELGGGRRGGAELREEFLGEASDRRTNTKVDGEYGGDSGDDSGVESLYIE